MNDPLMLVSQLPLTSCPMGWLAVFKADVPGASLFDGHVLEAVDADAPIETAVHAAMCEWTEDERHQRDVAVYDAARGDLLCKGRYRTGTLAYTESGQRWDTHRAGVLTIQRLKRELAGRLQVLYVAGGSEASVTVP